ncbi:phage portal protein, HK97 family [Variovorax sp. HW608]|uniref:phage portal protein n=1 Tax=Variovorax sp. HW608 TaxID=1034889 RepID=UPI00081FA807|nr:phage portal protein [Variovorax sp. HW608]SCK49082.1 phage portal protein, HK97 family [Variovorax sp. HW608]
MKLRELVPSLMPRLAHAVKGFFSTEGSWRGPFMAIGELGGSFRVEPTGDGWQRNLEVPTFGVRRIPAAYAAVMANAAAVAQCWPRHLRETGAAAEFARVTTSPAFRIFRKPNAYETWPVFMLNLVAAMQFDGTGYAIALRDDKGAITSLHRVPTGGAAPFISPVDGSVYYSIGHNELTPDFTGSIEGLAYVVAARDVMALRQYCPRHPLRGESPATAAALAMGINVALSRSQAVFFSRMSRPSGVLVSDQQLTAVQITRARENWESQATLLAQGGVPVLGNGMKWIPMTITSEDSQLIEAQRLSIEDIARVYRVPLPVIGDLTHATLTNVESLISFWLSTGLGSLLELVERAFDEMFGFDNVTEYCDFDTTALLRTDFAGRIEALCKGIQGGLYKPDEARAREGLGRVPGGDTVYVQQQMVPLGTTGQSTTPIAAPPSPAEPAANDGPGDGQGGPVELSLAVGETMSSEQVARALMKRLGVREPQS